MSASHRSRYLTPAAPLQYRSTLPVVPVHNHRASRGVLAEHTVKLGVCVDVSEEVKVLGAHRLGGKRIRQQIWVPHAQVGWMTSVDIIYTNT
jgi:hypothetical protein